MQEILPEETCDSRDIIPNEDVLFVSKLLQSPLEARKGFVRD